MIVSRQTAKSAVLALLVMAFGQTARAQIGGISIPHIDPSDLDPTNKDSELRKVLKHAEEQTHKQIDSAFGGPFVVTIRNPTNGNIYYSFNGEQQIALAGHMQRVHRGVGNASIRFDRGIGNGSYFDYALPSGKSYYFQRVRTDFPEIGDVDMLNLFAESGEGRSGSVTLAGQTGFFENAHSGLALVPLRETENQNGGGILLYRVKGDGIPDQRWMLVETKHGFRIQNAVSGLSLVPIRETVNQNGGRLLIYRVKGDDLPDQNWHLAKTKYGYIIKNVASGLSLVPIRETVGQNGGKLIMYRVVGDGAPDQNWNFREIR